MDTKQYWRLTLYCQFLDHLISQLKDRLLNNEERFKAQFLLPSKVEHLDQLRAVQIFSAYDNDVVDQEGFIHETERWKGRWMLMDRQQRPSLLCEALEATDILLYPLIHRVMQILITMPPTSATAERSFSVLKA